MHFEYHSAQQKDVKKTVHWIFKFMANWECRITLAGVADILSKCFITKNVLEKNQTPIAARRARDRLSLELRGYCGTCAHASDLMERFLGRGGAAVVAEVEARGAAPETFMEEVVRFIAVDGRRSIRPRYLRGDKFYDELVPMGELSAEMCKRAFQRLRKFGESCTEQLTRRFPDVESYARYDIFNREWAFSQAQFATDVAGLFAVASSAIQPPSTYPQLLLSFR